MGRQRSSDPAAAGRVKGFAREARGLGEDETVMVVELRCSEPGCPPVETSVAVLDESGEWRQFKVHKPVAEVAFEDISRSVDGGGEGLDVQERAGP